MTLSHAVARVEPRQSLDAEHLLDRGHQPCPTCYGQGFVEREFLRDRIACLDCRSTGIDLDVAAFRIETESRLFLIEEDRDGMIALFRELDIIAGMGSPEDCDGFALSMRRMADRCEALGLYVQEAALRRIVEGGR